MILHVFAVYDSKLRAFLKPMHVSHPTLALRDWTAVANDPESAIGKHPEDYTLFQIAEYDDDTGTYRSIQHINHGVAANYRSRDHGKDA